MTQPNQPSYEPPTSPSSPPPSPAYPPPPSYPPYPGYTPRPPYLADANSKKVLAGLMGILLGQLGIHKFVLGYSGAGIIMLLISLTCVGAPVMHVIGLVEGIIYLTKSDEDFYQTYMVNKKEWF
jgi:TM2 domain-containing membrane protein YozV